MNDNGGMLNLPPRAGVRLDGAQWSNLHTFAVAARHLSFARAADELCLSASAVSHRIARLERALGTRLFLRLTRSLRLSEDGERIYQAWMAGQAQLEAALCPRDDAEPAGAVALYARPSLAQCWLAPRLADFAERYPRIALEIRSGNEMVDFRTWNIDLALYYSAGEFPGLDAQRLMDEQVAPVCSPEYADRHGLHGNPAALAACLLLHDAQAWERAAHDAEWREWARRQNVALPSRGMSFDRSELCAQAAAHHAGVALGRRRLVQRQLERGELILPLGPFAPLGPQAYYLVRPPQAPSPRVRAVMDWLRVCAAD